MAETTTQEVDSKRGLRKTRTGVVLSSKMAKTIVVRVSRRTVHPKYRKVLTRWKNYYAHDENNEAKAGDRVEIVETRPLSKLKRWRLKTILQQASKA